jgi:hypothetical protein
MGDAPGGGWREIPADAEVAVALALSFIRAKGLVVGDLVRCLRCDHGRLRRDGEGTAAARRSLWVLIYHQPAPAWTGEPWLTTRLDVYDDGEVVLAGRSEHLESAE